MQITHELSKLDKLSLIFHTLVRNGVKIRTSLSENEYPTSFRLHSCRSSIAPILQTACGWLCIHEIEINILEVFNTEQIFF